MDHNTNDQGNCLLIYTTVHTHTHTPVSYTHLISVEHLPSSMCDIFSLPLQSPNYQLSLLRLCNAFFYSIVEFVNKFKFIFSKSATSLRYLFV